MKVGWQFWRVPKWAAGGRGGVLKHTWNPKNHNLEACEHYFISFEKESIKGNPL